MSLLLRAGRRFLLGQRWQTLLAVLGVALGVAIVVAVDLANDSARRAFEASMDGVTGRATHQLLGPPEGLPGETYASLRRTGLLPAAAPVVEGLVQHRDETLRLIGIDPFAEADFRPALADDRQADLNRFLTGPGALLPASTAARLDLSPGTDFEVTVAGRVQTLALTGLLEGDADVDGLLWVDVATAQTLLGRGNRLDRIDLYLPAEDAQGLARLRDALPPGLRLVTAEARGNAQREMTRAFETNLAAMSLLAIVVGGFLIYNTMTFAVLRRRPVLGIYRMLGVEPRQVVRLILLETGLLALLGILFGLVLGVALAEVLLDRVVQTINDLYFQLTLEAVRVAPAVLATGAGLGLAAALVAGLPAALEAGRTPPITTQRRSSLEAGIRRRLPLLNAMGLLLVAGGYGLAHYPVRALLPGFVALFLVILGAALLAPALLQLLTRLAAPLLDRLLPGIGHLAARDTGAGLSRSGVAVAALGIAVAASIGVGLMTGSFRHSVTSWLDQTLQGDMYVAAAASTSLRSGGHLPEALVDDLRGLPGVAAISTGRQVTLETGLGPVETLAIQMAPASYRGFRLLAERPGGSWPAFDGEQALLVSEPLAYRHGLAAGDSLTLYTARGPVALQVAGIYQDYGSDQGQLVMRRALYDAHWDDPAVGSVGLYLQPGADTDTVAAAVRARLADHPGRAVLSLTREIRERSLVIFDRTFAVTDVLRLLMIGIAFIGILSALSAMQLERRRDHATLRALGVTPWELWRLVALQALLIALAALLLAGPLGLVMSQLLVEVINLRAFGWRLPLSIGPAAFVEATLLALAAALLASIVPAWRIARTPPAEALREE
ncbi:MAG: FtsX-like permease family protein [Chromatiales bacterium]|nr:FtsX-like permease family protein [Chromatiales bacterium]